MKRRLKDHHTLQESEHPTSRSDHDAANNAAQVKLYDLISEGK